MSKRKLIIGVALLTLLVVGLILMQSQKEETRGAEHVFYGRVCLGPDKTKEDMILHFIVQGQRIFLDKNKDDIGHPEERLESDELEPIQEPNSDVKYQVKEIRLTKGLAMVSPELPQNLGLTVIVSGKQSFEQLGRVVMSTDPKNPGWAHLDGHSHLIFGDPEIQLVAGESAQLTFFFGTHAIGEGIDLGTPRILEADKMTDWNQLTEDNRFSTVVPKEGGPYPILEIEIPTDGEPFVDRLPLNEFC
jgi:hypothetical protein